MSEIQNDSSDEKIVSAAEKFSSKVKNPERSIEGWCVIIVNLPDEATQEDILDQISDHLSFGAENDMEALDESSKNISSAQPILSVQLNLDRKTGWTKGYSLVEFDRREHAVAVIEACKQGEVEIGGKKIDADFAFVVNDRQKAQKKSKSSEEQSLEEKERELPM